MSIKQELTIVKPETLDAVAKRVKYAEGKHDWPVDLEFLNGDDYDVFGIIYGEYHELLREICPNPGRAELQRIFDESLDLAAVAIRCAQKAADALAELEGK